MSEEVEMIALESTELQTISIDAPHMDTTTDTTETTTEDIVQQLVARYQTVLDAGLAPDSTFGTSLQALVTDTMSIDNIVVHKPMLKPLWSSYVDKLSNPVEPALVEEANAGEDDDDDDEDDEDAVFASVNDDFRKDYGRVVWVKTNSSWPWWPSHIYDPVNISTKLKARTAKLINKKHVVMYYGSDDFDWASPAQIKDFASFRADLSSQKMSKSFIKSFQAALETADKEVSLDVDDRVAWKHINRRKRKVQVVTDAEAPDVVEEIEIVEEAEEEAVDEPDEPEEEDEASEEEELFEEEAPVRMSSKSKKKRSREESGARAEGFKLEKKEKKPRKKPSVVSLEGAPKAKKAKVAVELEKKKPPVKVEETRMQRTCRLVSLVESYARPEALNAASALRVMEKLKEAALSLAELQESRAAEVVSNLRKHADPSIAAAAKQLRAHWKEAVAATVTMLAVPVEVEQAVALPDLALAPNNVATVEAKAKGAREELATEPLHEEPSATVASAETLVASISES